MVRMLLILVSLLALLSAPAAARGGPTKFIEVYVAVPADAQTTVTSAQAVQTIQRVLGSPTDAPCIGEWDPYNTATWTCSVEGWFRHELGQVFDYRVTVVPLQALPNAEPNFGRDACGSYNWGIYTFIDPWLTDAVGAGFTKNDRTMILTLGAGGWAGHFAPTDRNVDHFGMVGDWGVMENFNLRNACVPDWDTPSRGFSHEFAGMLGMYVSDGYSGALFVGNVMTANNKADLLRYSRQWLRNP
jgi:hypothetical protein